MTLLRAVSFALFIPACVLDATEPDELSRADSEITLGFGVEPHALMMNQKGYADTDLDMSEFFNGEHTVTAWVMPQFTFNDMGQIFGDPGIGGFVFGQGNYRSGNGGFGLAGDPVLYLEIGQKTATFLAPGYERRKWNHVAVVRTPGNLLGYTFNVYLNGTKLTPFTMDANGGISNAPDIHFGVFDPMTGAPSGKLRFGRALPGSSNGSRAYWQYYGLLDDVGVFSKALSAAEIANVMSNGLGGQPSLVAGWTFNKYEAGSWFALDAKFKRPITRFTPAYDIKVAAPRSNADAALFDNPFFVAPTTAIYQLPFGSDQVWKVSQEPDSPGGSHNGNAAFCWDLVKVGGAANQVIQAAASGDIVAEEETIDDGDPTNREGYYIQIQTADREYLTNLHLAKGSFTEVFLNGVAPLFLPQTGPAYWIPVQIGDDLAKVGPIANHLHIGGRDGIVSATSATTPLAFSAYYASTDQVNWTYVSRGMPKVGQYIKRAN